MLMLLRILTVHAPNLRTTHINVAEAERFELSGPFGPDAFKASAIDHSAKLPCCLCFALYGN